MRLRDILREAKTVDGERPIKIDRKKAEELFNRGKAIYIKYLPGEMDMSDNVFGITDKLWDANLNIYTAGQSPKEFGFDNIVAWLQKRAKMKLEFYTLKSGKLDAIWAEAITEGSGHTLSHFVASDDARTFSVYDKNQKKITTVSLKDLIKNHLTGIKNVKDFIQKFDRTTELGKQWQYYNGLVNVNLRGLNEARGQEYQVYHDSYTSALQTAEEYAQKQRYDINPDDWWDNVTVGPKRPSEGKTNRIKPIGLYKNGKLQKKTLNIQVYGMGDGKYELNVYIS